MTRVPEDGVVRVREFLEYLDAMDQARVIEGGRRLDADDLRALLRDKADLETDRDEWRSIAYSAIEERDAARAGIADLERKPGVARAALQNTRDWLEAEGYYTTDEDAALKGSSNHG